MGIGHTTETLCAIPTCRTRCVREVILEAEDLPLYRMAVRRMRYLILPSCCALQHLSQRNSYLTSICLQNHLVMLDKHN